MFSHSARVASMLVVASMLLARCGPASPPVVDAPAPETYPSPGDHDVDMVPTPRPTPSVSISPEQVREIAASWLPEVRHSARQRSGGSSPCPDDPVARCEYEGYPKLGFNNEQELELAAVGTPAEEFELSRAALKGFQPGQALDELVTPMHHWIVPVTVNGEGRNQIHVGWYNGTWQEIMCCVEPSISPNVTAVQQHYAERSEPVKIINVSTSEQIPLAWITEDEQDFLILLREPPLWLPTLREKVMQPYPASEFLTELAKLLSPE